MALTVTLKKRSKLMNMNLNVHEIAFDSSYPTGGETLTKQTLGLPEGVTAVLISPKSGYVFEYDEANEKVLAYWCDNDALADSAMVQVANATDLSGVTAVKVMAFGR